MQQNLNFSTLEVYLSIVLQVAMAGLNFSSNPAFFRFSPSWVFDQKSILVFSARKKLVA